MQILEFALLNLTAIRGSHFSGLLAAAILVATFLPPRQAHADTPVSENERNFDIHQKMSAVLRSHGADAASVEMLRGAIEESPLDIHMSIGIINWQSKSAGLLCDSPEIKAIVASLNTSVVLRFDHGVHLDCNDKDLIVVKML